MTVGVLAVQGGFELHLRALADVGIPARAVRAADDLSELRGLVLPGGESSVQLELVERLGLGEGLTRLVARGVPVLATCAGLILCARQVSPAQRSFGWLDVDVRRNAYGRQLDSFEAEDDAGSRAMVFIRAPRITRVGPSVAVLATHRGEPVLVQASGVTAATFHPELTGERDLFTACFGAAGARGR